MAMAEDAASVLEMWIQDVANLPAELQHLLEEIEAKDKKVAECRKEIHQRDLSMQKHLKTNGVGASNPKESGYVKTCMEHYETAAALQEEKVALSEKARVLLDRHVKRFDQQIKALEGSGILPPDPLMPSLLQPSPGNRIPPVSASSTTGASTPLHPVTGNASAAPAPAVANAAIARLASQQAAAPPAARHHPASPGGGGGSSAAGAGGTGGAGAGSSAGGAAPGTPGGSGAAARSDGGAGGARSQRESSTDAKRRRLNMPAQSSNLRQSSLGPTGTPRAPTPAGTRAGSAGPRATGNKKPAGTKGGSNLAPPAAGVGRLNPAAKKGRRKGAAARRKGANSDNGDDSALSEVDGSGSERLSAKGDGDGADDVAMGGVDDDDDDGGDGDDKKYCKCRNISYGNMVACDNDDCEYEWFHWNCVGMTREPAGKWYCDDCKAKLGLK